MSLVYPVVVPRKKKDEPARRPWGTGSKTEISEGVWRVSAPRSGGKRYVRIVKGSSQDAERVLRDLFAKAHRTPVGEDGTVAELARRWLEQGTTGSGRQSPKTKENYSELVRKWITPHLGKRKVTDLRRSDIRNAYAAMRSDGASTSTIDHVHRAVSSMLSFAVNIEWIEANFAMRMNVVTSPSYDHAQRSAVEMGSAKHASRPHPAWDHRRGRQGDCGGGSFGLPRM